MDQETQTQVAQLIDEGNAYLDKEQHRESLTCYCDALALFPDPLEQRPETLWLFTSIGDCLFHLGNYQKAIDALSDAIRCGGLGNPFIHFRLGQSHFELSNEAKAADELTRAFMGAGKEIFEDEPAKYFEFLKTKIEMPDAPR